MHITDDVVLLSCICPQLILILFNIMKRSLHLNYVNKLTLSIEVGLSAN